MQIDPIKATLKAPGSQALKEQYDKLLSTFAFKFNLRRYSKEQGGDLQRLLSMYFTDLRGRGVTLLHLSPQPQPFLSKYTPAHRKQPPNSS
jgi:hypothetical protein